MSLAAHEILHLVALTTGLLNMPDLGEQRYHYNLGEMKREHKACRGECDAPGLIGTGDSVYSVAQITGLDHAAQRARDEMRAAHRDGHDLNRSTER
jgi:hypothetical protein